ncbi:hypothetical protein B7W85_24895 [Allorhizobium ampelinum]|nr:hypothetical protein B7W85_24895 [Allorhizobium ampelinum]
MVEGRRPRPPGLTGVVTDPQRDQITMKQQEKVDGGESQVGLLLFGQATSTEPYSAECRHNPMPIKLVEASTPQPCLIPHPTFIGLPLAPSISRS